MACYDGFGNLMNHSIQIWTGEFSPDAADVGKKTILFYNRVDGNMWLGICDVTNNFRWELAGNTLGAGVGQPNFGNIADGRPVWIGNFDGLGPNKGVGHDNLLFYTPTDANWWLGTCTSPNNKFEWKLVCNTSGFGPPTPPIDFGTFGPEHTFWIGDFDGNGIDDVLFHFKGDGNWWLGSLDSSTNLIKWNLAGNTRGGTVAGTQVADFGQFTDEHIFWTGNFDGFAGDDVLFHFKGDGNWWLGSFEGDNLTVGSKLKRWNLAGNTSGIGPNQPNFGGFDEDHIFWMGKFENRRNRTNNANILFYYKGDGNWWLGSFSGDNNTTGSFLRWDNTANTQGQAIPVPGSQIQDFGELADGYHLFFIGDFNKTGPEDVLFYFSGDGNWWLGSHDAVPLLKWDPVGNTGRPYDAMVRLHFKFLVSPSSINTSAMLSNMQQLYQAAGILVQLASTENLNLEQFRDLDVGWCTKSLPAWTPMGIVPILGSTDDQDELYESRNFTVDDDHDVVAYFVRSVMGNDGRLNGCATYGDSPAVAIGQYASPWTLAHEVGHVLSLGHVDDNDRLMTGNSTNNITNPPPDLAGDEVRTMIIMAQHCED